MEEKFNPKNFVWTKKYQPTLKEFVGKKIKEKIIPYLKDNKAIPNFLFESRNAGTGKTSLAMAVVKELNCQHLILNSANERNIDTIRNKVLQFAQTMSIDGNKKAIIMDESDGMNKIAQEALKPILERFTSNVFFILTANNVNNIIEPIRDRCKIINFSNPEKEEITEYIIDIVTKENIDYTEDGIRELIKITYPSIRSVILFLQDLKTRNLDLVKANVKPNLFIFEEIYRLLKEKNHYEIKVKIFTGDINPRELNSFFWEKAVEENNIKLIQLTCLNEKDIAKGADPKIIVISSLYDMIK